MKFSTLFSVITALSAATSLAYAQGQGSCNWAATFDASTDLVSLDEIALYPLDPDQFTGKPALWQSFLSDITRIDFKKQKPKLILTHYLDPFSKDYPVKRFEDNDENYSAETFTISDELAEGWKKLGFVKNGKFKLPKPDDVIKKFNKITAEDGIPMKAYLNGSIADENDIYAKNLIAGNVPLVDIHDFVFHLPLLSAKRSQEYIRFMAFDYAVTNASPTTSPLNLIFEQGTKARNGVLTAQLILMHTGSVETDFQKLTFKQHIEQCYGFLEDLGFNLRVGGLQSYYNLAVVMTDNETMWFTGLLTSHLRILDNLHISNENRLVPLSKERAAEIKKELEKNLLRLESFNGKLEFYPADLIKRVADSTHKI